MSFEGSKGSKGSEGSEGSEGDGIVPKGKTTHYILCVASLLQNVFAVHRFAAMSIKPALRLLAER